MDASAWAQEDGSSQFTWPAAWRTGHPLDTNRDAAAETPFWEFCPQLRAMANHSLLTPGSRPPAERLIPLKPRKPSQGRFTPPFISIYLPFCVRLHRTSDY